MEAEPGRLDSDAPRSVDEALARASRHARSAIAEALCAVRALLDAASLATSGVPSDEQARLARIAQTLDGLASQLSGSDPSAPLLTAVLEALDEEITRWEERSREDAEARPVLRAFLGLREILWELGVRPETAHRDRPTPGPRRGVQRVPVEE